MSVVRNGFQTFVNQEPAPAAPGDFASANLRAFVPAFRMAVSSNDPVLVGNFAWYVPDAANGISSVHADDQGPNSLLGFVHREQGETIITEFLGMSREAVETGFPVSLMSKGDFWAYFTDGADVGAAVYADAATGAPTTDDDSGNNPATGFVVKTAVPVDVAFTASLAVATGVLTVSAVASGVLEAGQFISGTTVPSGVRITGQKSGTTGGVGDYYTDNLQAAAVTSRAMTAQAGKLAKISSW